MYLFTFIFMYTHTKLTGCQMLESPKPKAAKLDDLLRSGARRPGPQHN